MAGMPAPAPDPARSMALLWRAVDPPTRGPKQGLDVDGIVRTAIAVADEQGLAALSMRAVAERLGVGTMSLYTYVPAKAELLDLMVDLVCGDAAREEPPPGSWRARLEHVARANWALYHRHPWMLQAAFARPVLGPGVTAKYDRELGAVDGLGLDDVEMDAVLTLVAGHVEGAARRALEKVEAERRSGLSEQEWWEAHEPLLSRVFDPARFPLAARVGSAAGEAHQAAYSPEHAFEFGLARVLDGIEALVRERAEWPEEDA